jgi:KipI family sensor histidine kinase inhibitor
MSLQTLGDTGYLVTLGDKLDAALLARVRAFAARLAADKLTGVTEIVPAYGTVGVLYEPERIVTARGELPWRVVGEWLERHLEGKGPAAPRQVVKPKTHIVPVVYGGENGPDLEHVAKATKLTAAEVIKLHAGANYQVAAVGFTPGFPYLLGLPEKLTTARRATPRLRVPAGSVGIGGGQTGIYPRETPGGWQLIGRTALELFDAKRGEAAALFAAGDTVKFKAVDKLPAPVAAGDKRGSTPPTAKGDAATRYVEVVKPGTFMTVQDLGRRGYAALGVGPGGALDPWAATVANLAVGNAPGAALLECTYVGPVLRFSCDALVALVGAEAAGLPAGRPMVIKEGGELDCASLARGARLYVAVAGGLQVPTVLGGAGMLAGASIGGVNGRALEAGDRIPIGRELSRVEGEKWRLSSPVPAPSKKDVIEVRVVPGPDWAQIFRRFGPGGAVRAVESRRFQLSAKSDRMGLRLSGEPFVLPGGAGEQTSRPVVPGTVQVPPDGQPIILMADGQTIGGYPQLGQVASVDLALLAQARPGAEIVLRMTDISTAQNARLRVASDLVRLGVGLAMQR